ncbi:MAG: hypothetical protein JXA08_06435 [Methanomicrobiaceae archaeon]|nr:hypothetical protein [Methanomicrobiaceae archaeon]
MIQHLCPACGEDTDHEIVKEGHELLVRCTVCGGVRRVPRPKEPRIIAVKTIVSYEKESRICSIELLDDEVCAVGDMLVAECEDDAMGVEVTSIERDGVRVSKARAEEIQTIWTRLVEQVIVKASVHDGRTTLPLYIPTAGEEDFIIGSVYQAGKIRFRITRIKLREGALMKKEGWKAYARKIKRIYGTRI